MVSFVRQNSQDP